MVDLTFCGQSTNWHDLSQNEAGNCELHDFQQRTNKVQVCPCGGQLNMSEEMRSSTRQKIKQLIADAYMTFQGKRGARYGAQPWQKHHFLAKEFMRKIGRKNVFINNLIAFKLMKYCMQASNNKIGRKNGANIWITSEQSILRTKPVQNNLNDTPRCIIFGTIRNKWKKDPQKAVQIAIKLHEL